LDFDFGFASPPALVKHNNIYHLPTAAVESVTPVFIFRQNPFPNTFLYQFRTAGASVPNITAPGKDFSNHFAVRKPCDGTDLLLSEIKKAGSKLFRPGRCDTSIFIPAEAFFCGKH